MPETKLENRPTVEGSASGSMRYGVRADSGKHTATGTAGYIYESPPQRGTYYFAFFVRELDAARYVKALNAGQL